MENERVVLWGMGSYLTKRLPWIRESLNVVGMYDSNNSKAYMAEQLGYHFMTKDQLLERTYYDAIIITSTAEEVIWNYIRNDLGIDKPIYLASDLHRMWEKERYGCRVNSLGNEYSEQTFYVIQNPQNRHTGIFNIIGFMLSEIELVEKHKYIPIMDMKNWYSAFHKDLSEVGSVNAWELFFDQPMGYSLECLKNAQNVVYSDPFRTTCDNSVYWNQEKRKKYHRMYTEYIKYQQQFEEDYKKIVDTTWNSVENNKNEILGVSVRGTDYASGALMHAIQPSIDQIGDKIQEAIDNWGIKKIYVTSDSQESIDQLNTRFPGMVFYYERPLYDEYNPLVDMEIINMGFERENDIYLKNLEYISSVRMMERCGSFIGCRCGATMAALIIAGEFEHVYCFDLGLYGIDAPACHTVGTGKQLKM